MRVAMDYTVAAERLPPCLEHGDRQPVAGGKLVALVDEQLVAREPVEGEQAAGRELRPGARHPHLRRIGEDRPVQRDVLGFAFIVELFADARADLAGHLGGVDGRVHAAMDGEQPFELLEVGLHGGLHVRILQLAGQRRAVVGGRPMHLAERGGRGRMVLEARKPRLPVRPELGHHASLDEGPAHRRRVVLQLGEFLGVFRRQCVGNGRHQLGDLHDRTLQAAEGGGEFHRAAGAIGFATHQPSRGNPRGDPAHIGADPRIAGGTGREAVPFAIGQRQPPRTRPPIPKRAMGQPRNRDTGPIDLVASPRLRRGGGLSIGTLPDIISDL